MFWKTATAILLGSLWLAPINAVAQNASSPAKTDAALVKLLESVASRYHAKHADTAIAVGIISDGQQRVLLKGDASAGAPATADSLFEIGSITKAFTGTMLARLINDGRIKLDDPANSHLPDLLQLPDWKKKSISILDLATHRSSLPIQPPYLPLHAVMSGTAANPYSAYKQSDLEKMLKKLKLDRAPGEKYEYSNLGAGLLGHAIVHKTGDDYESAVGKLLLKPLKMESTVISLKPEGLSKRLAVPHLPNGQPVSVWDFACLKGCGALRSSVNDMLTFAKVCLEADEDSDDPIRKALALAMSPRPEFKGKTTRVGLFWHITKRNSGDIVWHNGGTGGSRSYFGINPSTKQAIVILTNCNVPVDRMGFDLLDDLADARKPDGKPNAADATK